MKGSSKVERLLQEMERLGLEGKLEAPLDRFSYSIAVLAWSSTNVFDASERAWAIVERMEDLADAGHVALAPDTNVYTTAIRALSTIPGVEAQQHALHILTRMKKRKIVPNLVTYRTMLETIGGQFDRLPTILRETKRMGLHPPDRVFKDAITMVRRSSRPDVWEIIGEIVAVRNETV